ncbi:hypothetical protein [uncultured Bilophila sp.]|uniref:hypothetical protein n=1 Tax=uncultured Bilophila sp. TaxID=529385 RepID=UPI00266F9B69|nr:hypothetical protein [uncultured Bilophila sp.]
MNAGELVVSLILSVGDFKAQVQNAQKGLDGVQAAAVDAGRDVSDAAKRGGRGLDNLGSAARSAGKELEEAGNRGALSFENLKGTLTKIFGVIGGVAFIKSQLTEFTDAALEVDMASKTLGMDIKEFQGWQKAAEKVGLETQDLVQLFGDVSDRMYDAVLHDAGPFKDAVDDIGISLKGVKEGATSSADMLLRFAKAVEKMPKDKAHGLLTQYGFDPESIKLIMMGEKELEKLIKTGKEKARFDKQDIENVKKQKEAQQRLNNAWKKGSAAVLNMVLPLMTAVIDIVIKLFKIIEENKQFVIAFFTTLGTMISVVMTPALLKMATAAWAAVAPFTPFILVAAALGLIFDDLKTYIEGGESALGKFWKLFGEGDEIAVRLKIIWEGIKSILGGVWDALSGVAKLFNSILTLDGKGVIEALKTIWRGISKINDVLVEMLDWVAQKLYNLLPDWIKDWLGGDESSRPEETKAEAAPGGVADSMRVGDVRPSILPPQVRAGDARPGSVSNINNSSRQTVFNNDIEIITQATDGQGVATDLDKLWRSQTFQADSAFGY